MVPMLRLTSIALLSLSFLSVSCGSWAKSTSDAAKLCVEARTQRNLASVTQRNLASMRRQSGIVMLLRSFADVPEKLVDRSSVAWGVVAGGWPANFSSGPGSWFFPYSGGSAHELRDLGLLLSSTPMSSKSA